MRHHSRSFRSGFTLLELLIVIMVIAILMALTVSAAFSFIVNARETATATTISKVNGLLQERIRSFRQYDLSDAAIRLTEAWNTNNASDNVMTAELAEVLLRKPRFKQAFPQSFTEADRTRLFPSVAFTYSAGPPVAYTLASPVTGYDTKYECGIVLYAFLANGETFGAPSVADDAFTGSEVRVGPETNNLPCLVDAWGEPLRFYRWPTRLFRCGEQDFDGNGAYDDFNQNGTQDPAGITASVGSLSIGVAIRPYALYPGPTPASLLISNLPPYDRSTSSTYRLGADGQPGVADVDDDNDPTFDNASETGWPGTDDPEPLNTDPDDPTYLLDTWFNDSKISAVFLRDRRRDFVKLEPGATTPLNNLHDFYTFHTPLVVSSGPDKRLGLYEPTNTDPVTHINDPTTFGYLAAPRPAEPGLTYATSTMRYLMDNITNHNQRTGGK